LEKHKGSSENISYLIILPKIFWVILEIMKDPREIPGNPFKKLKKQ